MNEPVTQVKVDGKLHDIAPTGSYTTVPQVIDLIELAINRKLGNRLTDLVKIVVKYGLGSKYEAPALYPSALNPGNAWKDTNYHFTSTEGAYIWRTESFQISNDGVHFTLSGTWSTPIRLTGDEGKQGPSAKAGVDGNSTEFIFTRTENVTNVVTPETNQEDDWSGVSYGSVWTDHPLGVSETYLCEWVSQRVKKNGTWSHYSTPSLWAKWGDVGQDGDSIQYVYKRTATETAPPRVVDLSDAIINEEKELIPYGWTDDPTGVSEEYPYEWVMKRKYNSETLYTAAFSSPALWSKFGKNGIGHTPVIASINNNNIHLDNDTPATTLSNTELSTSSISVIQGETELVYGKEWEIVNSVFSGDSEVTNALSVIHSNGQIKFVYNVGVSSFNMQEGAIKYATYKFDIHYFKEIEGYLSQQINIVVRDITSGENYTLTASPGAIVVDSNYTTIGSTYILLYTSKVVNGVTSKVNGLVLKNLSDIGTIQNNTLTIRKGTSVNSPITIALCKNELDAENDIYLDSEDIEICIQGEPGKDYRAYSVLLDNDNISVSPSLNPAELKQASLTKVKVFYGESEVYKYSISTPDYYEVEGSSIWLKEIPSTNTQAAITVTVEDWTFTKLQTILLTADSYRLIVSPQVISASNDKTTFVDDDTVSLNLQLYKAGSWQDCKDVKYVVNDNLQVQNLFNLSSLGAILNVYRIEAFVNNELVDWEEINVIPLAKDGLDGQDLTDPLLLYPRGTYFILTIDLYGETDVVLFNVDVVADSALVEMSTGKIEGANADRIIVENEYKDINSSFGVTISTSQSNTSTLVEGIAIIPLIVTLRDEGQVFTKTVYVQVEFRSSYKFNPTEAQDPL